MEEKEYTICYKGELYITVKAFSLNDALELGHEELDKVPGYFKIRDTDIERVNYIYLQ